MSCNTGRLTKRKIIVLSFLGVGIAAGTYFAFSTTNNPAVAAAVPALAAFAMCPAICAAVGGLIWFMNRSSKDNGKEAKFVQKDQEMSSVSSDANPKQTTTDYKVQLQTPPSNTKLLSEDNKDNALPSSEKLEEQKSIYKN
jgi:hypothetical protein